MKGHSLSIAYCPGGKKRFLIILIGSIMFSIQSLFGQQKGKPQEPIRPFAYIEKEVSFVNKVDGKVLNGTLTLPDDKKNYPAVILVTGSGAHNRDEQIGAHKPFLVIADHLTQLGIAVLRYDDRHLTMSVRQGWKYTTIDLAGDAKAALDYLSSLSNIDASFIGLAGHSEGGVIASMVASSEASVSFVISLAGPGLSGREISMNQAIALAENARDLRFRKEVIEVLSKEPDINLRKQKVKRMANIIYGRFNIKAKLKIGLYLDMTVSEWSKFFTDYNPAKAWQKVTCPVLVINGEYDQQVQADKNLAAIEQALKLAGNEDYTTIKIPKANHLFQITENRYPKDDEEMVKGYLEMEQTIAPEVLKIIGDWIVLKYQMKLSSVSV